MCVCFSDLIFYSYFCIDNLYYYYFFWKNSFFYAVYKNDSRIKKYLSNRSLFLYLQISLELEKVYKKIVIFYYISGYNFKFFFFDFVLSLHFFLSLFPNLYYFFVQIAFFFLFSFFFSKFYIEFKETMERERVYINCCFEYEV
jgi:hypothetical protein